MFTGLVRHIGHVLAAEPTGDGGLAVQLAVEGLIPTPREGDSVAIDGCCLTVSGEPRCDQDRCELTFQAVPQTLQMTTISSLVSGQHVHVEPALCAGDPLGGHIVQGHVEGTGRVVAMEADGDDCRMTLEVSREIAAMIVPRGSICLAGVSLTVADTDDDQFTVVLVPTTLTKTLLGDLKVGDHLNVETDMLVRAVAQVVRSMRVAETDLMG